MRWLQRRASLACRQAVELVTDYLDGALADGERRRFEEHLSVCPGCAEYVAQIRATVALGARVEPDELSGDARRALVALHREWRSSES